MKEKIKNILAVIVFIVILAVGVLTYPGFIEVENGETVCRNLLGYRMDCRD